MYRKKICILGAAGTGKSCLVRRFLRRDSEEDRATAKGAKNDKLDVEVDRHKVQLMLWDIRGGDHVLPGFVNYIKGASAIIYVADGTRLETLAMAMEYRRQADAYLGNTIPGIMLFNKSDLARQWKITPGMISDAETNGIFALLTSCCEDSGINTAFNLITRVMMGKTTLLPGRTMTPASTSGVDANQKPRF
jgi:small GTP-binding protein